MPSGTSACVSGGPILHGPEFLLTFAPVARPLYAAGGALVAAVAARTQLGLLELRAREMRL